MGRCRCFRGESYGDIILRSDLNAQHIQMTFWRLYSWHQVPVWPQQQSPHAQTRDSLRTLRFAVEPQSRLPWISQPLEQKTARPAAKIYADHCSSADLAALGGNDLINYLKTHSRDCLSDVLWTFDDNMPAIFTNQNMQTVLKAIEALVPTYDGTNATGLHQLWFFVRIGYYHAFYEDEILSFNEETIRAHVSASKAFAASAHFYDLNDEAANILDDWFTVADQDQVRQHHLVEVKRVLSGLTSERAASNAQLRAYNRVFFLIFRGIVKPRSGLYRRPRSRHGNR